MNAFQLLGLPQTAALEEEAARSAYFNAAKTQGESADLHAAYDTLLRPEKRLRHLLELAAPPEATAWRTVPMSDELMNLFLHLGRARTATETLVAKKEKITSALARALLEKQLLSQRDELENIGITLDSRRRTLEALLPSHEAHWPQLATLQAQFSYLAKWQAQVAELLLKLS
jgi:hypothetical protein